jgi:peptidoglycan/xylan/chitin deacetylase (PgdA/CDA1 family)
MGRKRKTQSATWEIVRGIALTLPGAVAAQRARQTRRRLRQANIITTPKLMTNRPTSIILPAFLLTVFAFAQQPSTNFTWPDGKRAALSLSFDDARQSQVDAGLALLDKHKVKATFYVVPSAVERRLEGWKKVVASGHEVGNHSLNHPCTGNFEWSRQKALEDYTIEKMRDELMQANRRIKELLGVTAESFAYPCGQTFVGRGVETRSYVPVVAALFSSGRTWQDETPNDPGFCDLAQTTGVEMDGRDFEQILPIRERRGGR